MKILYKSLSVFWYGYSICILLCATCFLLGNFLYAEHITIVGTGYVGIVSGVGLAELGHTVACVDIDQNKIQQLTNGILPIYEPGVQDLMKKHLKKGNISFSHDVATALRRAPLIMIAVGTPMDQDGNANLSALWSVMNTISQNVVDGDKKIVCIKSTVPINTHRYVQEYFQHHLPAGAHCDVISNPEFLREGSALRDFLHHNPIVLGGSSDGALEKMKKIYQPLIDGGAELITTDNASAEIIKYAWNSYSAIKVAYVNQLSLLCKKTGGDITTIVHGLAQSEKLLPIGVVKPGPGFGGSCFPKDTAALVQFGKTHGIDVSMVDAALTANAHHKKHMVELLLQLCNGSVAGKKIGILGLSFKANTDDIRYSPAIDVIQHVLDKGAVVAAYDPRAMENMKKMFPDIEYGCDMYDVMQNADALVVLTEWDEFKTMDLNRAKEMMHTPLMFDTRGVFDKKILADYGFISI